MEIGCDVREYCCCRIVWPNTQNYRFVFVGILQESYLDLYKILTKKLKPRDHGQNKIEKDWGYEQQEVDADLSKAFFSLLKHISSSLAQAFPKRQCVVRIAVSGVIGSYFLENDEARTETQSTVIEREDIDEGDMQHIVCKFGCFA